MKRQRVKNCTHEDLNNTFQRIQPLLRERASERAELFSSELASEVSLKHPLYGLKATAVAARIDRDDVLFEIEDGDVPLAVVHLTWQKESDPRWPTTKFFGSWQLWVRDEMLPAHEEYDS